MANESAREDEDQYMASSPYHSNDEHEDSQEPVAKKARVATEEPIDSEVQEEIHSLNKQLHAALTKNVSLHNSQNKALALLRKINSQNQDLLEALLLLEPDLANVPAAPSVTLTEEQEERFRLQTNW